MSHGEAKSGSKKPVIGFLWAMLFGTSILWVNSVPRGQSAFDMVPLRGEVRYGFPLLFGVVNFEPDDRDAPEPSRFLYFNLERLQVTNAVSLTVTGCVSCLLGLLGFVGISQACRESRVVTFAFRSLWLLVTISVTAYVVVMTVAIRFDPEFQLLDQVAVAICVIWLVIVIGTIQNAVETLAGLLLKSPDVYR